MFKKLRNNNGGLSLMELLVAVAILAILVSPLLKSFVSSANLTQKSRMMAEATNAAQNVVESLQGRMLADVVANPSGTLGADNAAFYVFDDVDDKFVSDGATAEAGADKYIIGLESVYASSGGHAFDAVLTLDATGYATNTTEITQYSPLDTVYTQATDVFRGSNYSLTDVEVQNPDTAAAMDFAAQISTELGGEEPFDPMDILRNGMERTITIFVKYDEARNEAVISCQYSYVCRITAGGEPFELSYEHPEDFMPRKRLSEDAPGEVGAIYFFYYPNYSYGGSSGDTIKICNNNEGSPLPGTKNLDFTLFLIKQRAYSYAGLMTNASTAADKEDFYSQIQTWDEAYRVGVSLVQNYRTIGTDYINAQIHSNIGSNVIGGHDLAANTQYTRINGGERTPQDIVDQLVVTKQENRFYSVNIDLYEAGTLPFPDDFDPEETKPLLSYDASKLD